jgi:hypothetical protein
MSDAGMPRSRSVSLMAALAAADGELGQVLALLRADGVEEPEAMELGTGDRRLLRLYRELAGRPAELNVTCGACGTISSVELDPDALPATAPRVAVLGGGGLRGPTYGDLVELPADPRDAESALLRRLVVGTPARPAEADDLELVDDSLAGPLVLECVGCGRPLEAPVDVERLALELLVRLLVEVEVEIHLLARTYHWPLAAIEELPDERRSRLAELVLEGR